MAQSLRRRAVLFGAGGILAVVAAGGFRLASSSVRGYLYDVLVEEFGPHVAANADAERFANDVADQLLQGRSPAWFARYRTAIAVRGTEFGANQRQYLRDLTVTMFLRHTNAYRVWRGVDARLVYGTINPYEAGCGNFLNAANRPPNYLAV
jgi:hypothetical protein